jgi:hypothetical protein
LQTAADVIRLGFHFKASGAPMENGVVEEVQTIMDVDNGWKVNQWKDMAKAS